MPDVEKTTFGRWGNCINAWFPQRPTQRCTRKTGWTSCLDVEELNVIVERSQRPFGMDVETFNVQCSLSLSTEKHLPHRFYVLTFQVSNSVFHWVFLGVVLWMPSREFWFRNLLFITNCRIHAISHGKATLFRKFVSSSPQRPERQRQLNQPQRPDILRM